MFFALIPMMILPVILLCTEKMCIRDSMSHDYVTYNMACEYYRLGIKPVVRMAHEARAVYKIGKKVLIRRSIFEAYLREQRKI